MSTSSHYLLGFLARTQHVVTPLTALAIVITRSAGVAYFALGALVCALSAKGLKKVLRQPRPLLMPENNKKRRPIKHIKKTYGMPSTHSAAMSFMATYIILAAMQLPLHRSIANRITNHPSHEITLRTIGPSMGVVWAALVALSRIWLGHHTLGQVFAGCFVGVFFAFAWFQSYILGINVVGGQFEEWAEGILRWMIKPNPLSS